MPTTSSRPKHSKAAVHSGSGKKIVHSCTIRKPAADLFQFCRNPENFTRFSDHILGVTRITDKESHWRVRGPAKSEVEWDSIIINEHENEMIAWESKPGAEVRNAGSLRFATAPGDRGTEVTVSMEYEPFAGRIGAAVAKLSGEEPESQLADDLMRLKALMETGEIPTTVGQPTGPGKAQRRTK